MIKFKYDNFTIRYEISNDEVTWNISIPDLQIREREIFNYDPGYQYNMDRPKPYIEPIFNKKTIKFFGMKYIDNYLKIYDPNKRTSESEVRINPQEYFPGRCWWPA